MRDHHQVSAHMGGSPGSTTTGPVQRRTRVSRSETPPRCEYHRACLRCKLVSQKTSDTSRPDPLKAPALSCIEIRLGSYMPVAFMPVAFMPVAFMPVAFMPIALVDHPA